MELKYNLIEGNDAASRAILIMKYDLTKTLTENIISEQSVLIDYMFRQYMLRLYDWLKTFDAHDWLTVIEVSAGIAAMVSGPFAPIFLGIGGIAAATDSILYFQDGDPYMGTIMMALSIIPGGIAKGIFKTSKVFKKRGIKGSIDLIKKYKSGGKMTKEQAKDLSRIGIDFAKKSSQVNSAMVKELSGNLEKKSLKYLANFLLALGKLGLNLSGMVFKIGGTVYTFDQIYLYVFRDSVFKNKKYLDSRTQNSTRKKINDLIDNLRPYDNEIKESLTSESIEGITKIGEDLGKKVGVDTTITGTEHLEKAIEGEIKRQNTKIPVNKPLKSLSNSIAPTLDEVRSGKKVIKKGQKGDSVKELQKMLYSIGYGDYVSDGGTLSKWDDGNYGNSTELAVFAFQEYEGLNDVDGIVGVETLNKLIEKYDE
jgi:hypothetical protein